MIRQGAVTVNGKVVLDPEQRTYIDHDHIELNGLPVMASTRRVLMFNKPRGLITTSQDEKNRATVYDRLPDDALSLKAIGRLDKASEGLLLFTNDTRLAHHILAPETHLPKTYHVQINQQLNEDTLTRLRNGIELEPNIVTRPAIISVLRSGEKNSWLEITLTEGLNRQIRRMIAMVGADVLRLIRVRIGPISLGELGKGQTRELIEVEIKRLLSDNGL